MVTLAEIFRQYGPAYRAAHQDELLPSHLRVMWCIENCRTEALGGHVYQCEACGERVYSYHSCRNRHCNQCQVDYVFRIGISNSRLVKLENDEVTFWYKENKSKRRIYVTLPVFPFMRRFLQHVLPQGFVKVRYYGFYAAGQRHRLALARELLAADQRHSHAEPTAAPGTLTLNANEVGRPCPQCGQPMHCVQTIRLRSRCPP